MKIVDLTEQHRDLYYVCLEDWSDEMIQKTKDHFREHYGAELTTEDAIESLNNLTNLFELLMKWDQESKEKDEKAETTDH